MSALTVHLLSDLNRICGGEFIRSFNRRFNTTVEVDITVIDDQPFEQSIDEFAESNYHVIFGGLTDTLSRRNRTYFGCCPLSSQIGAYKATRPLPVSINTWEDVDNQFLEICYLSGSYWETIVINELPNALKRPRSSYAEVIASLVAEECHLMIDDSVNGNGFNGVAFREEIDCLAPGFRIDPLNDTTGSSELMESWNTAYRSLNWTQLYLKHFGETREQPMVNYGQLGVWPYTSYFGRLRRVLDSGTIHIGRTIWVDEVGEWEREIIESVVLLISEHYGRQIEIEYVLDASNNDQLVQSVNNSVIDVAVGAISTTPERHALVQFGIAYLEVKMGIAFSPSYGFHNVTNLTSLDGLTACVLPGTTCYDFTLREISNHPLTSYDSWSNLVLGLKANECDYSICDRILWDAVIVEGGDGVTVNPINFGISDYWAPCFKYERKGLPSIPPPEPPAPRGDFIILGATLQQWLGMTNSLIVFFSFLVSFSAVTLTTLFQFVFKKERLRGLSDQP